MSIGKDYLISVQIDADAAHMRGCVYDINMLNLNHSLYIILELKWIETVYDIEQCISWMDHAQQL